MTDACGILTDCPAIHEALNDKNGDYADDATWVLTSSFVILTMQSGFGMLEMGCSAPGHEVNIMLKNVFDVVFGALVYYFVGYGISFGQPSNSFMGLGDFFPDGSFSNHVASGKLYSSYLFQFSFAATSTTIVSGCIAMRLKFFIYCAFSFYAVIVYAFVAHWVWADDGWLRQMGVHDFAGSSVVHILGGVNGLLGILWVGPRLGRFDGTRPESDFRPSSPASILFGLFMLWWGWIGFNCGSSFGITDNKWLVATRAGVMTINSTAGGGIMALMYTQLTSGGRHVRPHDVANGILGSLVSTTATCACVHTHEALIIGFVGSALALLTNTVVEHRLELDDPVGGIGVHGVAGVWGMLAVGLFADSSFPGIEVDDGLFRGGGFRLLGVQIVAILSIIGWSLVCVSPFFYLMGVAVSREWRNPRVGLRVDPKEEVLGTDQFLHDIVSADVILESIHNCKIPLGEAPDDNVDADSAHDLEERVDRTTPPPNSVAPRVSEMREKFRSHDTGNHCNGRKGRRLSTLLPG